MKEYEVVYERKEIRQNVFKVQANSKEEAEEIADELNEDHDWNESSIIHGDDGVIQVREV